MAKLRIPSGPQGLTPQWLTQALRQTSAIRDTKVTSVDAVTIAEGVGLLGQLARVKLHYDSPEAGAPLSLIAKFPAEAQENREVGDLFRYYEREIRFYEEIAGEVQLRTPRCYYSAMDVDADEYVLLLEDMAPARVGDQLASCSPEEADLAIRELAGFHATWWDSPRLEELEWMPYANDPINMSVEQSYQDAWDTFLERFGARVPKSLLATAEKLGYRAGRILDQFADPPRTIGHGDYRLDNLFFATPEGGDPLAVIDWQIAFRGRGVFDVAYFMSTNLHPHERKAREMDILRGYQRILTKNGVRGYEFDQCLHEYRVSALLCLVYPVISGAYDLNERGMALVTAMLDRSVAAIIDLDAGELLPK